LNTFFESDAVAAEFAERVRSNQAKLISDLRSHYDFIVCGSGSSGSVVARRLAEYPDVSVLLLEAGGDDDVSEVMEAGNWPANLGSERDWNFQGQPNPRVNGRSIPFSMGKVLGGGSSINVMVWARGHKSDWDFFASEAGDPAWNYDSVLNIYRRIEDWHGTPDPKYRGTGGPVFVEPAPNQRHHARPTAAPTEGLARRQSSHATEGAAQRRSIAGRRSPHIDASGAKWLGVAKKRRCASSPRFASSFMIVMTTKRGWCANRTGHTMHEDRA